MPKLNQIIAIVKGKKAYTKRELTEVDKKIQKPTLFEGISRSYTPLDDGGETQPPEKKQIQYSVSQAISDARSILKETLNVVATQDVANQQASANVVVEGIVVLAGVPVPHLLYLEKQLIDLRTFVGSLPVLDPAEVWEWNDSTNNYSTPPTSTNRAKKVPRNHVLAVATPEHPAQVELYTEDVKVGEWKTIKYSGATSATNRDKMLFRITQLQDAVKFAREEANSMEVELSTLGGKVLDFIFED